MKTKRTIFALTLVALMFSALVGSPPLAMVVMVALVVVAIFVVVSSYMIALREKRLQQEQKAAMKAAG